MVTVTAWISIETLEDYLTGECDYNPSGWVEKDEEMCVAVNIPMSDVISVKDLGMEGVQIIFRWSTLDRERLIRDMTERACDKNDEALKRLSD